MYVTQGEAASVCKLMYSKQCKMIDHDGHSSYHNLAIKAYKLIGTDSTEQT